MLKKLIIIRFPDSSREQMLYNKTVFWPEEHFKVNYFKEIKVKVCFENSYETAVTCIANALHEKK